MKKFWLVVEYEFMTNLRKRSFLLALFGMPLFTVGLMAFVFLMTATAEGGQVNEGPIGYVDQANLLAAQVTFVDEVEFVPYSDQETVRAALDAEEIKAFFVLPSNYLLAGTAEVYAYGAVSRDLQNLIEKFVALQLAGRMDSPLPQERLQQPISMTVVLADSGRVLTRDAMIGAVLAPMALVVVLMMSLQITGGAVMSGISEEKSNRVIELLITSITPMQLLSGKLIALGALGLLQISVWLIIGLITVAIGGSLPALSGIQFPPDLILLTLAYFILTYFLYSSIMAGIGAITNSEEESRQISGLILMPIFIPFFVIFTFFTDPNGSLPTALSIIPFTAPLSMILRYTFGIVPPEQIAISLGLLVATTIFIIWASAKIFRWGLLMYGKRFSPREIWRAIRQPSGGSLHTEARQEAKS